MLSSSQKALLLFSSVLLLCASPSFAETSAPAANQELKSEIETLHAQMKTKQDKIKAAREALKPQIESLKADREKMKALVLSEQVSTAPSTISTSAVKVMELVRR